MAKDRQGIRKETLAKFVPQIDVEKGITQEDIEEFVSGLSDVEANWLRGMLKHYIKPQK
jgi:hypothetical protein